MQWLGVVDKIAAIPGFSEVLKDQLETNEQTKFPRRLKGGHLWFLELIKLKSFVKTDKCTCTTATVKLVINSVCTNSLLKHEV